MECRLNRRRVLVDGLNGENIMVGGLNGGHVMVSGPKWSMEIHGMSTK